MLNQSQGVTNYTPSTKKKIFFRASHRSTVDVTVKSGQVLKALSFIESDNGGNSIAHSGITEVAVATFTALTNGQTLIIAGLTFTAGASGTTVAQLITAWSDIEDGGDGGTVTGGTFSGTLSGYNTETIGTTVAFISTALETNATDLTASGTGTSPTFVISQGSTSTNKIQGVLCYDVDASSGDVKASAYSHASFWEDALTWGVDTSVDTITLADGTTKACTSYNTGCSGTSDASAKLKRKFVEGSNFHELGFKTKGEV